MDTQTVITIVGMVLAVFFMTSLYGKKNPFFSVSMSLMLGTALAYLAVYTINLIYTNNILVILRGNYLQVIPLILGLLLLTNLTTKYRYLSRIPVSFAAGTTLGLATRTIIFTDIIGFSKSAILPLFNPSNLYQTFFNITSLIFTVTVMSFFVYTVRRKGVINSSAKIGEYVLYAALGGYLANDFMGYSGTTLGVFSTYLKPLSNAYLFVGIGLTVLALVIILDKYGLLEKYAE
jgi:hypothetical protein